MPKPKTPARPVVKLELPPLGSEPGQLQAIGGSRSDIVNQWLVNHAGNALCFNRGDAEDQQRQYQAAALTMAEIAPRDALEGMLAAQMVATHAAAAECFRRAMLPEQTFQGRQENLNQANKLVRSYAAQLEALDRHRGKGQQRVRVEHVHVHQGGQAIVGAVLPGGGVPAEMEGQPHAPAAIAHEPVAPLRGQDAPGAPVPLAGDTRPPALPYARRRGR